MMGTDTGTVEDVLAIPQEGLFWAFIQGKKVDPYSGIGVSTRAIVSCISESPYTNRPVVL